MRILYSLGGYIFHTAMRLVSPWHRKARSIVQGRREIASRLKERIDVTRPVLWVHASSLGEFEQGRPLIELWRERHPDWQIVQTFFSPSGYEVRAEWGGVDAVTYLPADTERGMEEFLRYANPTIAVFVKYDLWPILLSKLKERGVPTYLISAIFRQEQLFFKPWGGWYLDLLKAFRHIYVQDEGSVRLLKAHKVEQVNQEGDTRFDRVWTIAQGRKQVPIIERMKALGGKLLVAGSTWEGDEDLLVEYLHQNPEIRLVIAPHEVGEGRISSLVGKLKRPHIRLSEVGEGQETAVPDCLIIDSIGLLSSIYGYGDVAYVGGGFGRGIHNTLEAAVYGIPVVWGARYKHFREACDLVEAGAGYPIHNFEELKERLDKLLQDPHLRAEAGEAARLYISRHIGTSQRIVSAIEKDYEASLGDTAHRTDKGL